MNIKYAKLVVFVPLSDCDAFRQAMGDAGAGKIGDYDHCSFSSRGFGRFRGSKKTNPAIGQAGEHERVEEERIEFLVPVEQLERMVEIAKTVHPYEEVALDVYPLMHLEQA